ncbi:MAG: hypothetical protein WA395_09880 [Nitrososphaeraceae archaeon]
MNLDKSINNLSKRIERFDSFDSDGNDSKHWKGKAIIPLTHCLLSPDRDDPIFIGINRLVAKGLQNNENQSIPIRIEYPCPVVNRFECPL